jgi:PAS domain S-box-containing protein
MEPNSDIPQGYPVDPRNFGTLLYHPYPPGGPTKDFSYPVFGFPMTHTMPTMMPLTGMFPFAASSVPGLSMGPFAFDPSMVGGILHPTSVMPSFLSDCGSSAPTSTGEIAPASPTEESSSGGGGGKFSRISETTSSDSSWFYPSSNLTDKVVIGAKDKRRYRWVYIVITRFILFYFSREQNKLFARQARQRKKNELEDLKDQLNSLQAENLNLKQVIVAQQQQYQKDSHHPNKIPSDPLCVDFQLPENIQKMVFQMIASERKVCQLENYLPLTQRAFVLVNPALPDCPIIYVSMGFVLLTGYSPQECYGKNCRFLQGPETDQVQVYNMKQALSQAMDVSALLINYDKEGTSFWNQIDISHLRGEDGKVGLILGIQFKVRKNQILFVQCNHLNNCFLQLSVTLYQLEFVWIDKENYSTLLIYCNLWKRMRSRAVTRSSNNFAEHSRN